MTSDLTGTRVANAFGKNWGERTPQPPDPHPIDLLLSFAFHSKLDHHDVKRRLPSGSLMWIDSGAFTAYTTGKKFTVPQYAEHLQRARGAWDYAFTLDVIGDHRGTMKQTEQLRSMGLPVVPIFTFGTPLAEWRALCRDYGYVGAGGLVPIAKDRNRILKYLRTLTHIADEHGTAVHALGTAGRSTVIQSRVWSADSSTVSSAPLYGNIPIYDRRSRRLIMLSASDTEGLYRHREALLRYGFPLDVVMREKKWSSTERPAMFRASLLSVAEMWADVRRSHPRSAPERLQVPDSWGESEGSPVGPRPAYAQGPGNDKSLDYALGPRSARAASPHDIPKRLDAALEGPRTVQALTTNEGVQSL